MFSVSIAVRAAAASPAPTAAMPAERSVSISASRRAVSSSTINTDSFNWFMLHPLRVNL